MSDKLKNRNMILQLTIASFLVVIPWGTIGAHYGLVLGVLGLVVQIVGLFWEFKIIFLFLKRG